MYMTTSKIAQMASLLSSPELLNTQKQSQSTNFVFGAFLSQTAGGRNQEFFSCETAGQSPSQADTVKQAAYEKESAKSGYRESSISNSEALDNQKKLPEDVQDKLEASQGGSGRKPWGFRRRDYTADGSSGAYRYGFDGSFQACRLGDGTDRQ